MVKNISNENLALVLEAKNQFFTGKPVTNPTTIHNKELVDKYKRAKKKIKKEKEGI